MLVPDFPADFTNSDTKADDLPAISICALLIDSLTMSLYIKWSILPAFEFQL